MKILWISHILPYPPNGGVMQRSYNLIKEIAKYNEVHLVTFNQKAWNATTEEIEVAKKEMLKFCKHIEVVELVSDSSPFGRYILAFKSLFTVLPYSVNWLKSKKFSNSLKRISLKDKFDVIHFDTIGFETCFKYLKDVPKVLNHHNVESHLILRRAKHDSNIFKKLYYQIEGVKLKKYEQKNCGRYDLNVMVSGLDMERLQEYTPNLNADVVPNGVDTDYFTPMNVRKEKNSIIFVASFDWYPNHDAAMYLLKDVWPNIKRAKPELKLYLVGRKPNTQLTELALKSKDVEVTGFVDDVRPYMSRSEIYICPILDGGGTKLKLLDAMSMGCAIVSTKIGAEGIEVEDNNNILLAETTEALVAKVVDLHDNIELQKSISENARDFVKNNYSWTSIGRKLSDQYKNLG